MNKVLLFICCAMLSTLFTKTGIMGQSIDWTLHTPAPCDDPSIPNLNWEGPKEYTICADTVSALSGCSNVQCCFTVVYYDYLLYMGNYYDYLVDVVGIFWTGPDCDHCSKDAVMEAWYEKFLAYKYSDPSFAQLMNAGDPFYIYTPAVCLDQNGNICELPIQHCCYEYVDVQLNQNGIPDNFTWNGTITVIPPCQVDCSPVCRNFRYDPIYMIDCDANLPCSYDPWTYKVSPLIDISSCPGCQIEIHYRYRQTLHCQPQYNDYEISKIVTTGCMNCGLTEQELIEAGIDWVLKYGELKLPDPGHCSDNWRIVTASCWEWRYDGAFIPCPDVNGCCWTLYRICNINNNITREKLSGFSSDVADCNTSSHPCIFLCDQQFLPRIIPTENQLSNEISGSSKIIPNPSTGSLDLEYQSPIKGNISLQIYNNTGALTLTKNLTKSTETTRYHLDLKVNPGVYYYKLFCDNKTISMGAFIIK